jgi:LMBR1 domain-containing protein 1
VEPLVYVIKLLVGIVCIVISLIIVIHLFCYILLKINGRPVHPFLNNMLEGLENSSVSVLATIMFAFIGYYLMFCSMKGNVRVGMRLLCFTFYPLLPNETFVNSFIFNAIIMNLWMFALVQFMTDMFKEYIRQTSISMIFSVQIKNMYFFKWFLQYSVFNYILIGWICISGIYFILKPSERINLGMQVKKTDLAARA